ncbi:MAG: hypothetical protein J7K51_05550 [Thermotogae bacterium]|nr:hypothetical protein [Thermotogota bacterium]
MKLIYPNSIPALWNEKIIPVKLARSVEGILLLGSSYECDTIIRRDRSLTILSDSPKANDIMELRSIGQV